MKYSLSAFGLITFMVISLLATTAGSQIVYEEAVQINATTQGHQDSPTIAINRYGTVLVVFESETSGGEELVFAVSYDRESFREFYRTGPGTDTASLEAVPSTGNFVVTWEQNGNVYYTIVSCSDGQESFLLEPTPAEDMGGANRPDVAINPANDEFFIGWHASGNVGYMRFFSKDGQPLCGILPLGAQSETQKAQVNGQFDGNNVLTVVWHSERYDQSVDKNDRDIFFQCYDCSNVTETTPPVLLFDGDRRANGDLSSDDPVPFVQEYPEVAVFSDGTFVVSWQDFPYTDNGDGTDGNFKGSFFRIFNPDGTSMTDDIQTSEHNFGMQKDADIEVHNGNHTIHFCYEDAYEAPYKTHWKAYTMYRPFSVDGSPLSESICLSSENYGTDSRLALTEADAEAPNLLCFVWETKDSQNYDGSGRAVLFRDYSEHMSPTYVAAESDVRSHLPKGLFLSKNYPNPFNPGTSIRYFLPGYAEVAVDIYNIVGRKVRNLVDSPQTSGWHSVRWDGRDDLGVPLGSGLYICRLKADAGCLYGRILLVR